MDEKEREREIERRNGFAKNPRQFFVSEKNLLEKYCMTAKYKKNKLLISILLHREKNAKEHGPIV